MKRIGVFLMVLVLFIPALGICESNLSEQVKNMELYSETVLKALIEQYDKDPSVFDADFINLAYTMYRMNVVANDAYFAALNFDAKVNFLVGGMVATKKEDLSYRTTWNFILGFLGEDYEKWIAGEKSDKEFAGTVMKMAKALYEE